MFWVYEVRNCELVSSDPLIWFLENFTLPVWFIVVTYVNVSTEWCGFRHFSVFSWANFLSSFQEVTQKILEAVGNIAGSSLEQTSWLSRNLEVKAQPQISLEESDAEEDLCGRYTGSENDTCWGAWVAQSAERPTLDFASGHDPRVVGSSPASGSVLCRACFRFSLSLLLPLSPTHALSPPLKLIS